MEEARQYPAVIKEAAFLLVFVGSSMWFGIVLVHAARTGVMWARGGNICRADRPISFWISAVIAAAALIFSLGMTLVMTAGMSGYLK